MLYMCTIPSGHQVPCPMTKASSVSRMEDDSSVGFRVRPGLESSHPSQQLQMGAATESAHTRLSLHLRIRNDAHRVESECPVAIRMTMVSQKNKEMVPTLRNGWDQKPRVTICFCWPSPRPESLGSFHLPPSPIEARKYPVFLSSPEHILLSF